MAKPLEHVLTREPLKLLISSTCNHGLIDTRNEAYIESKATGGAYCDMVCLCESEGIEYTTARRQWIKEEYEVIIHG